MPKTFEKLLTPLNIVFLLQLIVVGLIAIGVVEREASLALLAVVLFFLFFSSLEDSLMYTVRTIPFFVALPLTESFDSFNMWRIVVGVVFLKWFLSRNLKSWVYSFNLGKYWRDHQFEFFAVIVLTLSVSSLLAASDLAAGLKRIIYFANIIVLYPVVKSVLTQERITLERFMKNISIGVLLVAAVGYLQLQSAFNWDFMKFMNFWALNVQNGFYGEAWSSIVYQANTWFAYLGGGGLRLRIFSTFPDSHSMPLYLLMGLISFLPFVVSKISGKFNFINLVLLLCIPLILFVLILSGTRGIWLGVVFPIFVLLGLFLWKKVEHKQLLKTGVAVLLLFLLLIPVASYLYTISQFRPAGAGEEEEAFLRRLRSSISLTETSNSARIEIWLSTLISFQKTPLLGVGIGNFPVVLNQDISLQKAGSSAHNLYLNVAAEIGFVGGVIFGLALLLLLGRAFQIFQKGKNDFVRMFGMFALLFLVWIFGYSLTDAALFDGRAFLLFVVTAAMVTAVYEKVRKNIGVL